MSYQEEGRVRLRRLRSKQAIALAMEGRWQDAVAANQSLIESFLSDVDAHNRLGRACMEIGEYSRAREAYSRALELDPYNTIAEKNLRRLSHLGEAVVGAETDSEKVEPKHGMRLIKLIEGGNEYSSSFICSTEDKVTVIIREVYQHPGQAGQPSFPTRGVEGIRAYGGDRMIRRELEYEEELVEEPGYTIISEEGEVLLKDVPSVDRKRDTTEE